MSQIRRSSRLSKQLPTKQPFMPYVKRKELKTKIPPYVLCDVLQRLTDAQKSNIRDMGFQSVLSFSIHSVPKGLGRWLLENYDHQRNELNVGTHVIEITPSKVHDVLGVPMGEIPVYEKRFSGDEDAIRNEWRKQPFPYGTVIYVKGVVELLKLCKEGGTLFKLNFLVVFNTIMGQSGEKPVVNQQFLSSIRKEDDICNMDWCSYIITCLNRTKEEWNGVDPYNGPLTFLAVLYAHELQLKNSPEKAITPAIRYVTTVYLVDLAIDQIVNVSQDVEDKDPLLPYDTDKELKITNKPDDLCDVVQGLTDAQKSNIRDMGFQSVLSFSIRSIPMGLGRWLLYNYDRQRNELNVGTHTIEITRSKVHDVLGVPIGEIPVYEETFPEDEDVIRNEWRKQPFPNDTVIFVKDVIKELEVHKEGGRLFKINFLVVFNTIMGQSGKTPVVNKKFLSSIRNEDDIRNMDWCSYIITCLKRTKKKWNGIDPYNGPLTFLAVLYAHELQLKNSPEKAITPALQYVTTDYLVDLGEVQVQVDEGQTAVEQTVNVPQDVEDEDQFQSTDSLSPIDHNGKGSCSNDNVEMLRDENLHHDVDVDDDDIEILAARQQEEIELDENVSRSVDKFSSCQSDMVCVKGYTVNRGIAPTLADILKKHGDFASACILKTGPVYISLLESVCELYRQIQTNVVKNLSVAESVLADAKAVNMDVTWLEALLEGVRKKKEANKASVTRLKRLAQKDLRDNRTKFMAASQRLKENERFMEALHVVEKHLNDKSLGI